ncbi:hypothetical protein BDR05DRAFT_948358 [Suillus weaverae]|nr:hypothetical protein BDR05DRAFT_948358 [Suillus weaverae]
MSRAAGQRCVSTVVYSPDETKFATGGYFRSGLKIWDAKPGPLSTLEHQQVLGLARTANEKKFTSRSEPGIRIFDTTTWQQIAILKGHKALSGPSYYGTTASLDNNVYLWDIHAILKGGLENLLVPAGKSLMNSDAMRCPAQLKDACQRPRRSFDGA